MSFEAIRWAFEQELPAMQKFVLVALANRTNQHTGSCYPSLETLAKDCGMTRRSVINQTKILEEKNLLTIKRIRKDRNNNENNCNENNCYTLKITWGSERDSLGVVKEIHPPSERDSPKPGIKPIVFALADDHKNFEGIDDEPIFTPEEQACYEWAINHHFWAEQVTSKNRFQKLYKSNSHHGMKAQFKNWNAENEKAPRGDAGLFQNNNENGNTLNGGNYETHRRNNKKLSAHERVKRACERYAENFGGNIYDSEGNAV